MINIYAYMMRLVLKIFLMFLFVFTDIGWYDSILSTYGSYQQLDQILEIPLH